MWLYVLNVMCVYLIARWSNQKDFWVFYLFLELTSVALILKNLMIGNFMTHFASGCSPIQVTWWNEEISISSQNQAESFATQLWLLRNLDLTREINPMHLHNSQVTCESLTHEMSE